ncbi:MAG: prenyltransferase [Thermoanaerobaculia bacterium]
MSLRTLAGVARAPFLLLPVTLVAVGAAAASCDGSFSWSRTVLALVGLLGLHVAVNAFNEASDLRSGIDLETSRTPFSGGSGTLPTGALSPAAAVAMAIIGASIGLAAGVWFMLWVGPQLLPILVLGAVATLAYTEFLARHYVGELFAGLGLGALPVLGTALVQTGSLGPTAVWAALPAFLMTFNLLLLNEFPDEVADRAGGRRNLLLLLGRRGAALLYAVLALAVPAVIVAGVLSGALSAVALAALLPSLLLRAPLRWALSRPAAEVPVPALGANVGWNLLTNALLAATLALACRPPV